MIPRIKRLLRHARSEVLQQLAAQVLHCGNSDQVREELAHLYPEPFFQR